VLKVRLKEMADVAREATRIEQQLATRVHSRWQGTEDGASQSQGKEAQRAALLQEQADKEQRNQVHLPPRSLVAPFAAEFFGHPCALWMLPAKCSLSKRGAGEAGNSRSTQADSAATSRLHAAE
jgi:hypothetical protein